MLKQSIGIVLLSITVNAVAEPKTQQHVQKKAPQWVLIHQDEYGKTLVQRFIGNEAVSAEYPQAKRFAYKYVYTYGVPSLKIEPKGYIQAIHLINCAEQTRAYEMSQRFKPNGIAIDQDGTMPVYFEPMNLETPEDKALYQYICEAKY